MPFGRALFLKAATAAFFTGGLDMWSTPGPVSGTLMRVLISADRGRETPQLADGDMFTFAGKRWRGTPAIVALADGASGVVATVDVDRYLYGVVPVEASARWPLAALQAQAIVARTFALARRTPARPYDVVVTQADQRFGGIEAEYPATNAAVDTTQGATLTYNGSDASIFYAACCGGHTADAAEIWGHQTLPYLRGVADPYCVAAPDYRWQRTLPLERIRAALASRVSGTITGFALGPADACGRPLALDVLAGTQRSTLTTIEFRQLLGADTVRSTWIRTVALATGNGAPQVTIEGAGRGHGVGLCQWGARAMALAGSTAATILGFYFPGTSISSVDGAG